MVENKLIPMRPPNINQAIQEAISQERLQTYTEEVGGDLGKAIDLYEFNMLASEAFYVPLQCLEVCLRNKLDAEMTRILGSDWLLSTDLDPLTEHSVLLINEAANDIPVSQVRHGKLVAELKFGFWAGLLAKHYDATLWRKSLYKAFLAKGGKKRSDVQGRINVIRRFRNRVAHHEPIFHRPLDTLYDEILEALEWMCPQTAKWMADHSRVKDVLSRQAQP